jgi:hypothetical protein
MTYQHPHDRDDGRSIEELCKPLSATVSPLSVKLGRIGEVAEGTIMRNQRQLRANVGKGGGWRKLHLPGAPK